MSRPIIGIAGSHHLVNESYEVQMGGSRVIEAVAGVADGLPLLIPGLPDAVDIGDLLASLDGIVLPGGRANIHPRHYGEELTEAYGQMDEGRDEVVLPLVRAALAHGVPIFGLCKGIQEINVALGGSLYHEIGDLPGHHRHRMPTGCTDQAIIFELREKVRLRDDGVLARLLGTEEIVTNSLHGQAINRPGERIIVEGLATDGTIEAVSVANAASFAVGVQWHPEFDAGNDPVSRALFRAFGDAARTRHRRRSSVAA